MGFKRMAAASITDRSGRILSANQHAELEQLRHNPPDPRWNESGWFGFAIPDHNINAFFYYWRRPNMNLTAAGVALWDGHGSHRDDCLFYHWYPFNQMTSDTKMFDFELDNGMSVALREPLQSYQLKMDTPACQLDLLWEGVSPAYDLSFNEHESTGIDDWGDFHYEQFGHVTGSVAVDGVHFDVDCHHYRDRSWGIRKPFAPNLRGGADMCWISDGLAFCATMVTPDASEAPPDLDRLAYGVMIKDGILSVPASGQRRITKRADDGRPLEIEIDLEDAEGRTMHIRGRTTNCLNYVDLWYCDWSLAEWEIDGQTGWGEAQSFSSPDLARRRRQPLMMRT
jgi:hypothetical protein